MHTVCLTIRLFLLLCPATLTFAQVQETAREVDAGGGVSSNGSFTNLGAVGQGGPVGCNASLNHRNQSGFLNSFLLHPATATESPDTAPPAGGAMYLIEVLR